MKRKHLKKLMFFTLVAVSSISAPILLVACSNVNKELIDKTVAKGNGDVFAIGSENKKYDLNWFLKEALKADAGQRKLTDFVIASLALDWFKRAAKEPTEKMLKRTLDAQEKTVKDEYKNTFDSSKKTYGKDFSLKFQQDVLDQSGGTEASWKQKKMLEWAKSVLSGEIFKKFYLAVVKTDGDKQTVISHPVEDQILDAVSESNGYSFTFSKDAVENKNDFSDNEYAKFQQFVFDQWVQIENPFVLNMVLWKYGTPVNGINSLYNQSSTGLDDSQTKNSGNYKFPYFSDINSSHNNGSTIGKFKNFVNKAKQQENFVSNTNTKKANLGIRDIEPKLYTEDQSTLIFAKNSSIYNDMYIEFAAAGSYLFQDAFNSTEIVSKPANIEKSIDLNATPKIDLISDNFVKNTTIIRANNEPANVVLSNELSKAIVNENGPLKDLINSTAPNPFAQNNTGNISSIDTFQPNQSDKLNDFLMIRDEAGVHAVAIEGKKFIGDTTKKKTVSFEEAKKRAAKIVLYHHFNAENYKDDPPLAIDVKDQVTTFFNNNMEYLISEYIQKNNDQKLFLFDETFEKEFSNNKDNLKNLFNSVSTYLFELSKVDAVKEYNEKMLSAKQVYADAYGVDTKKNGFASKWIYNKSKKAKTNSFDVANTVEIVKKDPFDKNDGSYTKYVQLIDPFVNGLSLQPLKSNFDGFKYSQYIYTNNSLANEVLYSFGIDSNSMGDVIKIDILTEHLKDDFDLTNLKFKNDNHFWVDNSKINKDRTEKLNTALINSYFSSSFNDLSNKWFYYNKNQSSGSGSNPTDSNEISVDDLNYYRHWLYQKSNLVTNATSISEKLSLLTIIATAKKLLDNKGEEFLNYLKSKITVGTDAYVGWVSSYNQYLTPNPSSGGVTPFPTTPAQTPKYEKVEELLDRSTSKILKNVNNTYLTTYTNFGDVSDVDPIVLNNKNGFFAETNAYFNVVNNKIGYRGLVTSETDINSDIINKRLFVEPFDGEPNTGALYSYESAEKLKTIIDSYNYQSEIEGLAQKIKNKTKLITIDSVLNAPDLSKMKENFKKIVDDTLAKQTDLFKQLNGYIGKTKPASSPFAPGATTTPSDVLLVSPPDSNIKSGAFVFQLNNVNLESWDKFMSFFPTTINKLTQDDVAEIIYNLLFEAAKDTYYQDTALTSVLENKKVEVFDVRLNSQLGAKWVSNWKS